MPIVANGFGSIQRDFDASGGKHGTEDDGENNLRDFEEGIDASGGEHGREVDGENNLRDFEEGSCDLGAAVPLALRVARHLDLLGAQLQRRFTFLISRQENEGEEPDLEFDSAAAQDGGHGLDLDLGIVVLKCKLHCYNVDVIVIV